MKNSLKILIGAFAVIGVMSTGAMLSTKVYAQETEGQMTAPSAEISPVQAMKSAEEKTGGKAGMAMFEFEDGHWIYGVVVAKRGKLSEVEIDATSGKIGDVERITPAAEGREFGQELAKFAKSGN